MEGAVHVHADGRFTAVVSDGDLAALSFRNFPSQGEQVTFLNVSCDILKWWPFELSEKASEVPSSVESPLYRLQVHDGRVGSPLPPSTAASPAAPRARVLPRSSKQGGPGSYCGRVLLDDSGQ